MGNPGGRFVWYELATTDIETAKAFYANVVGWGTADVSMSGSVNSRFTVGDSPVAGLMQLPPDAARNGPAPQWIGFVEVDDVDVVAGRARKLGGTVHVPPTDVPGVSRFSVIADPQMAPLALVKWRERGHERPVQLGAPGRVGWHELLVADLEREFAFYNGLLGWQKAEVHVDSKGAYQQFSDGTETVGAMFTKPGASTLFLWLYYFNVPDIEAAAKRTEAGGGRITYGPIAVSGGARIVHCTDPQGAVFALMDRTVRIAVGCYSGRNPVGQTGTPGRTS